MAEKTVRVGLWEYFTEDGLRHLAFFGETVDIPESEIERGEKANVFGPPVFELEDVLDGSDLGDVEPPAGEPANTGATPVNRPKLTAPDASWIAYAEFRGVAVDGLDKEAIIAAIDELDKK